jgi:flagellar motor switch protein FliN
MANENQTTQLQGGRTATAERIMPLAFGGNERAVGRSMRHSILPKDGGLLPLEFMSDVPMILVFEVGRIDITIKQLLELDKGSYIELRNVSVDVIDIRVNDKLLGSGETIALQQRYGIRFNELEQFTSVEDLENGL